MEWWKICPSTKHWPVFARQLGWCSGGSLILGCTDSWPEALRNVGKVCEEEMLQPEHIEIKLGKTTNMFSEFTTLKPRFIETTMFNTYILLGEGLYLAIFSYNVSIFLPKRHSVFLLGITSSCWAFFLAPASCLFLPFPTKVGRGQGSPILPPSASYYSQVGAVISAWMIRCLLLETLKSVQVTGRERGFRGWIHHTGSCDCHSDVLIALWPSSLGLSRFSPSQTYYSSFLFQLPVSYVRLPESHINSSSYLSASKSQFLLLATRNPDWFNSVLYRISSTITEGKETSRLYPRAASSVSLEEGDEGMDSFSGDLKEHDDGASDIG